MKPEITPGDECLVELNDHLGTRQQVTVVRLYKGGNALVHDGLAERQCAVADLRKIDKRDGGCAMKPAEFADLFCACEDGREWAVANCATMDDAWATARPDWLVWIATRPGVIDDRTLRLFAVWCARQVQHLMTDPRSRAVLDVAERHANGQATDEELAAARAAAEAAAWAAARVARDAVWAAGAAARDATEIVAGAAAQAAARDARAAQAAWLRANATPDWERARQMGGAR